MVNSSQEWSGTWKGSLDGAWMEAILDLDWTWMGGLDWTCIGPRYTMDGLCIEYRRTLDGP